MKHYLRPAKSAVLKSLLRVATSTHQLTFTLHEYLLKCRPKLLGSKQHLLLLFHRDAQRYIQSSQHDANGVFCATRGALTANESLSALITMEYHRVEKSLSMRERRAGAGQDAVQRLIAAIEQQFFADGPTHEGAVGINVLKIYFTENAETLLKPLTIAAKSKFYSLYEHYEASGRLTANGGYRNVDKAELLKFSGEAFSNFLRARHSIRDYEQRAIPTHIVSDVVATAMSAPSVCNRQAWHVYAILDRQTILDCLQFQNGNRGFTERIPLLFIITSDLRRFVSPEERNQAWIDGGIFSMSLMLALHAEGLGACPLNWSATHDNDAALRNYMKLPDHEVIIMLLSAGALPEKLFVTASPRRDVGSILTIIDATDRAAIPHMEK